MVRTWTFERIEFSFLTRDVFLMARTARSDPDSPLEIECPVFTTPPHHYSHLVLQLCSLCECEMSKRVLSRASSVTSSHSSIENTRKRRREGEANQSTPRSNLKYIATAEDAARVDGDPPLQKLLKTVSLSLKPVEGTEAVVHWMRMADLRSECLENIVRDPDSLTWNGSC